MNIKVSLKADPNYGYVLVKDGQEAFCPFQQPLPMQGKVGGMSLLRLPCCTVCPKATLTTLPLGGLLYSTDCGAEATAYTVEVEKKDEGGLLIHP